MKVIVYATATWPWCTKVKSYLDSKNVDYEEVNVLEDRVAALEMVKRSHSRGVPVIEVNGDIVVGYDVNAINSLLGIS